MTVADETTSARSESQPERNRTSDDHRETITTNHGYNHRPSTRERHLVAVARMVIEPTAVPTPESISVVIVDGPTSELRMVR